MYVDEADVITAPAKPAEFVVLDRPELGRQFYPMNAAELAAAKQLFETLRQRGYFAYREDGSGGGTVINRFEDADERTVFVPHMIGG